MSETIFTTKKEEKSGETIFTIWKSSNKENKEIYSTKEFPEAIWTYSPMLKLEKNIIFQVKLQ